jgi:hypothetical protein
MGGRVKLATAASGRLLPVILAYFLSSEHPLSVKADIQITALG